MNNIASPRKASRSTRSYASGARSANVSPYLKSRGTLRTRNGEPGTFAANVNEMPSSGWMCRHMVLGSSKSTALAGSGRNGTLL
jgi:hypothetical protein